MEDAQSLGGVFRQWICAQRISGYAIAYKDESHLLLEGEAFFGETNFYPMEDGSEIVEMRITRRVDDEHVFFLHFMMEDIARAQELFGEMRDALLELSSAKKIEVLLCCTCGITTTMFAAKMDQISSTLDLGYRVQARPLDAAIAAGKGYDVVMLAPQVAYERRRVAEAFPDAVVFEIPAKVYGGYDAPGGIRLIANALDGHNRRMASSQDPLALPSDLHWPGCIMVVSTAYGARQSSVEYRVYERGEVVLTEQSTKRSFEFRDIEDLLAGARLQGIDVEKLDAIGIAVPGIIDDEHISLLMEGIHGYDLGGHIRETYGVPVFLDNDANAAAVGCNAIQSTYQSVSYHRQSFGHAVGGQGIVVDGRLIRGRRNFVGEVDHLLNALKWSADPQDLAWTEDGMYELVSRYLLMTCVEVAPEAIYVDAYPVDDMVRLRRELRAFLEDEYIPDLIPAPDFNECMLLGELALCVQRLRG